MTPECVTLLAGFVSGVGVAVVGALATIVAQRRHEDRRRKEAARFEVYTRLLELREVYWSIAMTEGQGPYSRRPETKRRVYELTWAIANKLQEVEQVEYLEEVLRVLMSPAFPSVRARYDAIETLLIDLGDLVSPRFAKAKLALRGRTWEEPCKRFLSRCALVQVPLPRST